MVRSDDAEPVSGATVELAPGRIAITNDKGEFYFENICEGTYRLLTRFVGFNNQETEVQIPVAAPLTIILTSQKTLLEGIEIHDHVNHVWRTTNYQVLGGKELDATRGLSLGESLRKISGVSSLQTGPSVFKPIIHGVHSQRILILNNGIRQEGQQWGAEHAPEIDPFIASNLVVIKDASAIKYGTDALGGVVVVTPAELPTQKDFGGEFNVVSQTNSRSATLSGMLEGGSERVEGLGWRVQGTAKKAGDFHTPRYNLSNTGFTEFNFSLAAGIHRKAKGIDVFFSRFQTELGILKGSSIGSTDDLRTAMEREPPQYTKPFTYTIENPRQHVTHNLLKLNGHLHTDYGDFNVLYGFQYNTRKEFDIRRDSLNGIPAIDLELITHTLDAGWTQHTTKKFCSSGGMNAMIQINDNLPGTQRIPFIPDFTNYSAGLYYIGKLDLKKWLADVGIRYDYRYYDVVGYDFANRLYTGKYSFGNASFSIGATRHFGKRSTFISNAGSSWRPPHVSELYSFGVHQSAAAIEYGLLLDETSGQVLDFNSVNFKNEKSLKWVNTWLYRNNRLATEITGYANYILNYIYLKPDGITQTVRGVYPYFRYTQTDASFIGLDASAKVQPGNNLTFAGKISLLRAADQTHDDYLMYIPANRYEFSAEWRKTFLKKLEQFNIESNFTFVDRQRRAPRVITVDHILEAYEQQRDPFGNDTRNFDFVPAPKAYLLLSLQAGTSIRISKSKLDVRLRIDNLLNRAYREYTNRMRYYADETGRNFTLSLQYRF